MTKKHYEAIAAIIARRVKVCTTAAVGESEHTYMKRLHELDTVADLLSDYFQQDNPRFDRERFLAACGIEK